MMKNKRTIRRYVEYERQNRTKALRILGLPDDTPDDLLIAHGIRFIKQRRPGFTVNSVECLFTQEYGPATIETYWSGSIGGTAHFHEIVDAICYSVVCEESRRRANGLAKDRIVLQ